MHVPKTQIGVRRKWPSYNTSRRVERWWALGCGHIGSGLLLLRSRRLDEEAGQTFVATGQNTRAPTASSRDARKCSNFCQAFRAQITITLTNSRHPLWNCLGDRFDPQQPRRHRRRANLYEGRDINPLQPAGIQGAGDGQVTGSRGTRSNTQFP